MTDVVGTDGWIPGVLSTRDAETGKCASRQLSNWAPLPLLRKSNALRHYCSCEIHLQQRLVPDGGEGNYKDGKVMTIVSWKPNGEKCPVTNVVNGNGVWVAYWENGKELARLTYRDGE